MQQNPPQAVSGKPTQHVPRGGEFGDNDLGGPFAEGGGGYGPVAGKVQVGSGSCGLVGVGYLGVGPGTPQGYASGTNTHVLQLW